MFPTWFHAVSTAMLALGVVCAAGLLVDVLRRPQKMAVMSAVWPVTALFGTVLTVWGYARYGRADDPAHPARPGHGDRAEPLAAAVGKGTLHCGAGCMIGDLLAEWLAFLVPSVAVAFGWHTLFAKETYAVWLLDFVFAFLLGIAFQYFAIQPMRHLPVGAAILAALKADALSLAAWQVGMYGAMALLQFEVFPRCFGGAAPVDSAEFWLAMQIAMIAGFCTAFPVNAWLIRIGLKERM